MSTRIDRHIWSNDLLTIQEVADYLRVSRSTVWRWCKDGTLPAFRIGRNWRIPQAHFLALEASLGQGVDEPAKDDPAPPMDPDQPILIKSTETEAASHD